MATAQTSPSDLKPNSLSSITLIGFWASTKYVMVWITHVRSGTLEPSITNRAMLSVHVCGSGALRFPGCRTASRRQPCRNPDQVGSFPGQRCGRHPGEARLIVPTVSPLPAFSRRSPGAAVRRDTDDIDRICGKIESLSPAHSRASLESSALSRCAHPGRGGEGVERVQGIPGGPRSWPWPRLLHDDDGHGEGATDGREAVPGARRD